MEVKTSDDLHWKYYAPKAPDNRKKMLLLTEGRVAILGRWAGTPGVIAHFPLPKRNKSREAEL